MPPALPSISIRPTPLAGQPAAQRLGLLRTIIFISKGRPAAGGGAEDHVTDPGDNSPWIMETVQHTIGAVNEVLTAAPPRPQIDRGRYRNPLE